MAIELIEPSRALEASYRSLVAEFQAANEPLVPFVLAFEHADFDAFLATLADCARGLGPPPDFPAHSTWWLVEDGTRVVGVANLRHALTPALERLGGHIGYGIRPSARGRGLSNELLRLTLERAAAYGIESALLTCDKDNVASARAIRYNGGALESEERLAETGHTVQRFRIPLHPRQA